MSDASKSKNRSPEHPFFDLPTALERAETLYEHEAFNWTNPAVAAGHWGYSDKSSRGRRTLAALKHFGLIEDVGTRKERRVRLSDLARRIIRDQREGSVDRVKAIREAALTPAIYEKVWQKWGGSGRLPSQATMEFQLEHEWDFNPKAIPDFIRDFVTTIEYAGLLGSRSAERDALDDEEAAESSRLGATESTPDSDTILASGGAGDSNVPKQKRSNQAGTADVMSLPIPLVSGEMAHLSIPVPLSVEDFDLLKATLESTLTVMRPALVRFRPDQDAP